MMAYTPEDRRDGGFPRLMELLLEVQATLVELNVATLVPLLLSMDREEQKRFFQANLSGDERRRMSEGIYRQEYAGYERFWNKLADRQRMHIRRSLLEQVSITVCGFVPAEEVSKRWDELSLLVQQLLILRTTAPMLRDLLVVQK